MIGVGARPAQRVLRDTHGTPVAVGGVMPRPMCLVFLPFAFSPVCHREVGGLSDRFPAFSDAGVDLMFVTCDPLFSLKAWAEQNRFSGVFLSDFWPHGDLSQAFGVFDETDGFAHRGSFLLDSTGVVRWSTRVGRGESRDLDTHLDALDVVRPGSATLLP